MEAHVGNYDEIFKKREKCVHARFAKSVVAPITVHRRSERKPVPTHNERFPSNKTLFVQIFYLVNGKSAYNDVEHLGGTVEGKVCEKTRD